MRNSKSQIGLKSNFGDGVGRVICAAFGLLLGLGDTSFAQQFPPTCIGSPTQLQWYGSTHKNLALGATKRKHLAASADAAKKLRGRLSRLVTKRKLAAGNPVAKARMIANHSLVFDDQVTVIIVPVEGFKPADLVPLLDPKEVTVIRIGRRHLKVALPFDSLQNIGKLEQIDHVRLPHKPKLEAISQGVESMNIGAWRNCQTAEADVKIAVIDSGFIGLTAAQAAGELPENAIQQDETDKGMETDTDHGVAVAEIIHDIIPGCKLYLVKVGDESDLEAAKDYCVANGIDIINHSMGWYGFNFFDGVAYDSVEPSPVAIVNDAAANGILWVNAAGNEADRNYRGKFNPHPDWPETHRFPNGSNINLLNDGYQIPAGSSARFYLTWNSWPETQNDYDLWLLIFSRGRWFYLDKWESRHRVAQPPEEVAYYPSVPETTWYGLLIYNHAASGSETLLLRSLDYDLNVQRGNTTPDGSIDCPADAASTVAVGAIQAQYYSTGPIESFSSQGPTNGAFTFQPILTKPDFCAPDRIDTWTYGETSPGYVGTSAASPHIAGLAGLVSSWFPNYSNDEIRAYLKSYSVDLGASGKDNTFGNGPVVLPESLDCNDNGVPDKCDIASTESQDCNANEIPDDCDLADGTSKDCNDNGVPDKCDIESTKSQDCNGNGVPDKCDIASTESQDCNGNEIPDDCDLADGTSFDANENEVPDECENQLIVNLSGPGSISGVGPPELGMPLPVGLPIELPTGTVVRLRAEKVNEYDIFLGWTGSIQSSEPEIEFVVIEDMNLTAEFCDSSPQSGLCGLGSNQAMLMSMVVLAFTCFFCDLRETV